MTVLNQAYNCKTWFTVVKMGFTSVKMSLKYILECELSHMILQIKFTIVKHCLQWYLKLRKYFLNCKTKFTFVKNDLQLQKLYLQVQKCILFCKLFQNQVSKWRNMIYKCQNLYISCVTYTNDYKSTK